MGNKKTDLIFHPIRLRLITTLLGKEMTPKALARSSHDIPQATLYRHIKRLSEGGLLEVVREEKVNGAIERTYALVQGAGRLTAEEMASLTKEEHVNYFSIFASGLIDTFNRYIGAADLNHVVEEGLSYSETLVYLSAAEKADFAAKIEALIGEIMQRGPAPDRKGYTLASIVIPKPSEES